MPKHKPTYVHQLCRGLRQYLQETEAREELQVLCKVRHRSQFDRWFPRAGLPPVKVRLTARVALRATRWWAEKQIKPPFVPSWATLRAMGCQLLMARRIRMIEILANHVGLGITSDQIYSYFPMHRREPDGEFALRFFRLMMRIRGLAGDKVLGPQLRSHPDWTVISAALDIEMRQGAKRTKILNRPLYLWTTPQRLQHHQTISTIFRRMGRKNRIV